MLKSFHPPFRILSLIFINFWVHKVFQVTSENLADWDPSSGLQVMLGYQEKPPVGLSSTVAPTPSRG